jgi:hypothetical protein
MIIVSRRCGTSWLAENLWGSEHSTTGEHGVIIKIWIEFWAFIDSIFYLRFTLRSFRKLSTQKAFPSLNSKNNNNPSYDLI